MTMSRFRTILSQSMENLKGSELKACWAVVGVVAVVRLGIALVRFLQVDELQLLHLAWLRTVGSVPGVDHELPQLSLLIDLLEPMWHLLGSSLLGIWVARTGMWIVSLAIFAALGWFAGRLLGPAPALAALTTLSLLTDFNERVIDVRSDGFLVLLWLLAFGLLATGSRGRRALLAGALTALAFAFNFKTLAVTPFLGLAALLPPQDEPFALRSSLRRAVTLGLGFALGAFVYFGYLALRGDFLLFVETLTRNLTVSSDTGIRMAPGLYLFQSLERNVPFYLLFVLGLFVLGRSHRQLSRLHWLPPLLFSVAYVWINPTFFPYNFIDVGPFWALPAGAGLAWLLAFLRARWEAVLGMTLVVVLSLVTLSRLGFLLIPTLGDQVAINRFAMAMTEPEDRVYDASGLILFRHGPYRWRLHSLMLPRYYDGEFRLQTLVQEQPWWLTVRSYRTEWLIPEDKMVLRTFYPSPRPDLGLLGWVFPPGGWENEGEARFPVLATGRYRLLSENVPPENLVLDGQPYRGPLVLERGEHRLELRRRPAEGEPSIALVWSPPGMEEALDELPDRRLKWFYSFLY